MPVVYESRKLNPFVILGGAFVLFFLFIGLMGSFGTIQAGERGILLRFGAVTGKVLNEGLYFKWPFVESVVKMDTRILKDQVEASAASKDLQTVRSTVAVNFHIDPEKVATIFQDVGIEYKERLIDPAMQESVKSSTAKFTAEELITKREQVREDVQGLLIQKLSSRGIIIDDFNIVNFEFSRSFNDAIELKVTAEQEALAAKNRLEQIKFEAEQRVAEAKGKAEAMKVESEALKSNPQILELRALEKWDGKLPQFIGSGTIPFVNVGRTTP